MNEPISGDDGKWKVCAVCGYPLDKFTPDKEQGDVFEWGHFLPRDHVAIPINADEIEHKQQCDFCNEEPVVWEIMATSFEMFPETPISAAQMSLGGWGACADCGELIRRDRWGALISRVRLKAGYPTPREALEYLYSRLQVHMTEIIPYAEWRARQSYPLPNE